MTPFGSSGNLKGARLEHGRLVLVSRLVSVKVAMVDGRIVVERNRATGGFMSEEVYNHKAIMTKSGHRRYKDELFCTGTELTPEGQKEALAELGMTSFPKFIGPELETAFKLGRIRYREYTRMFKQSVYAEMGYEMVKA